MAINLLWYIADFHGILYFSPSNFQRKLLISSISHPHRSDLMQTVPQLRLLSELTYSNNYLVVRSSYLNCDKKRLLMCFDVSRIESIRHCPECVWTPFQSYYYLNFSNFFFVFKIVFNVMFLFLHFFKKILYRIQHDRHYAICALRNIIQLDCKIIWIKRSPN